MPRTVTRALNLERVEGKLDYDYRYNQPDQYYLAWPHVFCNWVDVGTGASLSPRPITRPPPGTV